MSNRNSALLFFAAFVELGVCGCNGTTGGGLVTFTARAGGPANATAGAPLEFDAGSGFHLSLTKALFHFGAAYLNMQVPLPGAGAQSCVQPGIYVAEEYGACDADGHCGVDLDLLSPVLTPLPLPGNGTASQAVEAEVWLTGGDVNALSDSTPILDVAGTATRAGQSWPFTAVVTISSNRAARIQNAALPGANPICHQRIVDRIAVDITPSEGGTLDLRVDPAGMFNGVDFSSLSPESTVPPSYIIPDEPGGAGGALYKGVDSNSGVYGFTWTDKAQ